VSSDADKKWEAYKESVPGLQQLITEQNLEVPDDSTVDYMNFVASLPADVAAKLPEANKQDYEKELPKKIEHRWCLCDMPEGDFPRIHSYANLSGLLDAVAKREGKETAVWAMYGVPLQLSKVRNRGTEEDKDLYRYLFLPDNTAVIVARKEPLKFINQADLPEDIEMEDQGWLGDPALFESGGYYLERAISDNQLSADPDMNDEEPGSEEPAA
jgi:hypothetical protein